jgi:ribosomal protein S18 acetylase RimI-like enzyme
MQFIYRKLKSTEAKDFRRIRLECLQKSPEVFGTTYQDEVVKPKLYFEELIERDTPEVFFFGAFADDELIAIAGFVRGNRTKTRHSGEIAAMYVNPDFRGQRVGENLLRALCLAIFALEGVEQVFLTVIDDNAPAVKLYERIGFEIFGVQKNYFKLGERYWNRQFMQLMKDKFRNS